MKYIFVTGAPGSKWSSVIKNIYYSADIDRTDASDQRSYAVPSAYQGAPMHTGSYFDPGMEFGTWFDQLDQHSQLECELEFDRPFCGQGTRIIRSHVFAHHIAFLKQTWPQYPIVMVHRSDDACLGWWVRCGGFNITYPDYTKYYRDLSFMADAIVKQNAALMTHWNMGTAVQNNLDLCAALNIACPPDSYRQIYSDHDIAVRVY